VNPTTGAPACASVLDGTDPNCVPFNIWSPNPPSSSSLAYLNVPGFQTGSMTQQVIGGTITANLGDFGIRVPGSRRGVEIALGAERRSESLDFRSDTEFATHDLEGAGSPIRDVKGAFVVKEAFGEIRIPVLDVANLSGSYRRSNYDTGVATDTFGAGFNATPTKILHVRGSFQRAVRAPDLQELFSPQFPNGYGLGDEVNPGDPCEGLKPLRSLGDCQRTGVTAANYGRIVTNPFNGYPSTAGGNPGLNPETAKTYTLGLVLAPTRDLSLTVDYFDIRIEKTISSIPADLIFYQCLDTGDPFYCSKITRDPATGALWLGAGNIFEINQNIGKTRVAGTDVAVNYRLRLPQGHNVLFDGMGTYLQKQSVEAFPGAEEADCAGFFQSDCANIPLPRWRHRLRVTWQPPSSFELAATWRYIHETRAAPDSGVPVAFSKLPSISYIDLAGSWSITKQVMLRGGVNNVADRDPPLTTGGAGALNGNAYAQIYDVLGRHVFVSLSVKF
jgi:outer membrane receptor protein involved in Fe transport